MPKTGMNTTIEKDLYNDIKKLALKLSIAQDKRININDLVEDGMRLVLEKYKEPTKKGTS